MKKKGFTLIELMVVVVIIGILAAIAIPNFVKVIEKARAASVKGNMHTLQVAVETANVDSNGVYPTSTTWADSGYLPHNFKNPYTNSTLKATASGSPGAYGLQFDAQAADTGKACYNGTGTTYKITGCGNKPLPLTLSAGTT